MRQYAVWQAPFYSFWSKSFYIDVAKNWHGLGYLYLLVLLCFTWLFMSIKTEIDFSYHADHFLKPLIQQLPAITINKGTLSINRPSPYTIKNSDGEAIITFDTGEKPMTPEHAPAIFLVTKKTIVFKGSQLDKQIIEQSKDPALAARYNKNPARDQDMDLFSTIDQAVIDQNTVNQVVDRFKNSVAFLLFIIALPLGFVLCVLQSLIYGLFAMAIASANQINLTYGTAVRLSTIALTPVLLIDSLLHMRNLVSLLGGVNSLLWSLVALSITMGYIIFAIRANMTDPNQKTQPSGS
jgi:Protein of unknown function (DUF1189)